MGTVYRAVHPAMSRLVALKVMSRDYLQDRRAIARFQREIRTAAALDHPHIVRALDAGCEKNIHYLVMEHVDGKDLRHWIKAAGPLPVPWSCECVRQAAVGLQHAFERGVIHRDLKPSNLLVLGKSLEGEPKVKIVDFGLARVGEDLGGDVKLTRIGRTVGTWAYIAPEQARDSASADIRSDIFSLGCALFEMVTGALPFKGTSDLDTLMMRLKVDAPRMSTLRSEIDPRLDEIVARMLAREPSQRFQTPAEVAQILASSPHAWKSKPESRPVSPDAGTGDRFQGDSLRRHRSGVRSVRAHDARFFGPQQLRERQSRSGQSRSSPVLMVANHNSGRRVPGGPRNRRLGADPLSVVWTTERSPGNCIQLGSPKRLPMILADEPGERDWRAMRLASSRRRQSRIVRQALGESGNEFLQRSGSFAGNQIFQDLGKLFVVVTNMLQRIQPHTDDREGHPQIVDELTEAFRINLGQCRKIIRGNCHHSNSSLPI